MNYTAIKAAMDNYAASTGAPVSLGFHDLETGTEYFINGSLKSPTASIFKIWVLLALFRMIENGEASMDEKMTYTEDDVTIGSGILCFLKPGITMTLGDFVFLMIGHSDNAATDMIIRRVGLDRVQALIRELDLPGTIVRVNCRDLLKCLDDLNEDDVKIIGKKTMRLMPFSTCELEESNYSNAEDLIKTWKLLYEGKILSAEKTDECIEIFKKCQTNNKLPRKLPWGVPIAHKTGTIDRVSNDSGIVYTNKGNYILTVMYNGNMAGPEEFMANFKDVAAENDMADLSRAVFNAYIA